MAQTKGDATAARREGGLAARRAPRFDDTLGDEPPLGLSPALDGPGRFAPHARWLAAIALMGVVAAALMVGGLYAALGRAKRVVRAPALVRPAAPPQADGDGRTDRLSPRRGPIDPAIARTEVEQVSASGSGVARFTHFVADLARVGDEPPPPANGSAETGPDAPHTPPPEILLDLAERLAAPGLGALARLAEPGPAKTGPGEPLNVTAVARSLSGETETERVIVANPNDTLALVLRALGAPSKAASEIAAQFPGASGAFAGGERIVALQDVSRQPRAETQLLRVSVAPPGAPATAAVALCDDGRYRPVAAPGLRDDEAFASRGVGGEGPAAASRESLRATLYRLGDRNRIERTLVDQLVRICEHDVDLNAPVSAGDQAELLYGPDAGGAEALVFAKLTVEGKTHKYYQYTSPDDESADYYDDSGRSTTTFLLRKPVAEGRLGDGFGWRVHPVLRDRRFHEGVDYAAPFGAPIVAAGAGVVEKIDSQWGYGKYVRIRHDWGYETTYAHVAGFPPGVTPGARVRQGQPIAYVGSTGLSTGPHLYYEVEINGRRVDPLRIKLAGGRWLRGDALSAFARRRARIDGLLEASPAIASNVR